MPLHSESDDLKGGNNAGVRSTRLDRRGFLKGLLRVRVRVRVKVKVQDALDELPRLDVVDAADDHVDAAWVTVRARARVRVRPRSRPRGRREGRRYPCDRAS